MINYHNRKIGVIGLLVFCLILITYIILAITPANDIDYVKLTGIPQIILDIIALLILFIPLLITFLSLFQVFSIRTALPPMIIKEKIKSIGNLIVCPRCHRQYLKSVNYCRYCNLLFNKAIPFGVSNKSNNRWFLVSLILFSIILFLLGKNRILIANHLTNYRNSSPTPEPIDELRLFDLINNWRTTNGFIAYSENMDICKYTSELLEKTKNKQEVYAYFDQKKIYNYSDFYGISVTGPTLDQKFLDTVITDNPNNILNQKNKYACLKCDTNTCYILTANPAPNITATIKSTNIDCTGPDGKHFQTTQKECDDFNAAWGKKETKPTSQTSIPKTIIIPKYTSTTIKTIPCVLSVGVYQLTEADCAYLKLQISNQTRQPIVASPIPTPDWDSILSKPAPIDKNRQLNDCINSAYGKYNQRMNELSALNTADSSVGQEALSTRDNEIGECHNLYD